VTFSFVCDFQKLLSGNADRKIKKKKNIFFLGIRIILPTQIQLLYIEETPIKINFPNTVLYTVLYSNVVKF
jgi:hypothetical protein